MLRSPTHIVGHGPTSSPSTTTTTALNGTSNGGSPNGNTNRLLRSGSNGQNGHHHHQQQQQTPTRTSLFDSCHRKIRLIGGGPVAFLGGLVAKARRKERDGDQSATDTKLYLEESVLERKLPDADLRDLVDLPAGLDYNEWLASHTLALFEHVNLVYGTISEFCTTSGCPDMTGPGNRTYLWFDEKGKKTRVAAPQYIDYVMTFTQKTVSDESIFPTKFANEFPGSFESIARKILRLQFHVIAHLYAAHFREIATLGLHTHLNLTFAHLTALHRRFNLIDEKETDVLRDLEIALRLTEDDRTSAAAAAGTITAAESPKTTSTISSGIGSNSMCAATCSSTSTATTATTTSNIMTNNQGTDISGSKIIGNNTSTTTSDDSSLIHHQQQRTSSPSPTATSTALSTSTTIDGDATVQPICTQPEAMRGMCDQRGRGDGRGGCGGGDGNAGGSDGSVDGISVGVGCVGSGIGRYHPGYCGNITINNNNNSNNQTGINWTNSSSSSVGVTKENDLNSSHIGNNLFGYSNTNINHNSSTHSITTNSLLQQCNSNSSSSRQNSHTTTA